MSPDSPPRDNWNERPHLLDHPTLSDYVRRVYESPTTAALDELRREVLRFYGRGKSAAVNAKALATLDAQIAERRAALLANDAR